MSTPTPAYGRRQARGQQLWAEDTQRPAYDGPTYYDRPAIKPSHYKWLISGYLFAGGLAGASQIIASAADLFGRESDRGVVRAGRYLALLGALIGPILLVKDLQTPKRFYNMLRIFRPTSPMSIGSWTLAAFGTFSGLTAALQLLEDMTGSTFIRWLSRLANVPAGVAGAVMSCYTGSLLSATSVPLWATVSRWLPPLFGASAMSTAAAATSLAMDRAGASNEAHHGMERIALAASAAEFAMAVGCELKWKESGLGSPLKEEPKLLWAYRVGALQLGILLPLTIHIVQVLTGRRSRWLSGLASASTLAGGFAQRAALTFAGNASAERPRDYFRFTGSGSNGRATAS